MNRLTIVLALLALASCASGGQEASVNPQKVQAAQVYQSLRLQQVELQMINDDDQITYGNAVVACGLRDQHWLNLLQAVYIRDYALELQKIPLTQDQLVDAKLFAENRIQNPSPPPLICSMLAKDDALEQLDGFVGTEALTVASSR
jgi:hypothetical protein